MIEPPKVLIYRNFLLPPSQTFVKNQAEALLAFSPDYVGLRRVSGLGLPETRTHLVNRDQFRGRLNEIAAIFGKFPASWLQRIQGVSPRLIHAHFAQDGAIALPLAKALNLPLVVTVHGYDITVEDAFAERSLIQKVYFRRRQLLKQKAQRFIAVSEFIKQKLLTQGFPAEKILVHYIGIDPEKFKPDPALPRQPMVLFVGRLVEKKGCEYLIQAMSRVQRLRPEVELVIIGNGPQRLELEQLAQQHLSHFRFLGIQSPEQVRFWLNQATVFSVPSVTARSGDAEGFGLVFAEAQAMGVPVVSFASGGVPEAVAADQTGFLVPERDVQGLASSILRLFAEPELWQRFSQAAQQRVRTQFNLHDQTRILEQIYLEQVLPVETLQWVA